MGDLWTIRDYDAATDEAFVYLGWLQSYRYGKRVVDGSVRHNPAFHIEKTAYEKYQRRVIDSLMRHTQVRVACVAEHPEQICGWVCFEPMHGELVLHYVYVKERYRGEFGIARGLILATGYDDAKGLTFTHWTCESGYAVRRHGWKYNPFLLHREHV